MTAKSCPSKETLVGYLTGSIPEDVAETVAAHLNACRECERTVRSLEAIPDPLVIALREQPQQDLPVTNADVRELLDRLLQDREQPAQVAAVQGGSLPLMSMSRVPEDGSPSPRMSSAGADNSLSTASPRRAPVLGDYELVKKLGQGGMGTVYMARHVKLKRVVAVKVLPKNRLSNPEAVTRFEREMEAVGRLDHPHIVRAMDAREVGGVHFLVMEHVDGLDLAKVIRRVGPLTIADACEVVRQAALGLQCSDENGLVHRDIKPANLMLTSGGEVKVMDLGLAQIREPGELDGEMTGVDQVMGTPDYMSPEQALQSHGVDVRTDIYSLGCTLYCLLAGRPPFSGRKYDTPIKKVAAHLHEETPSIEQVRSDVPKPVVATLERMLRKAPETRLASPTALIDALAPFCQGSKLISLLREARRKGPAESERQASAINTADLRASAEVQTSQPARRAESPAAGAGPAEFDPYHRWLGIPPEDQPADHYRLLGIPRFETDPEVIRDAAARQMAHVRTYHLGEHADLSQKILNELAAAKACLANPQKKAAYDAQLRERLQPAEQATSPEPELAVLERLAEGVQAVPLIPPRLSGLRIRKPPAKYWIPAAALAGFLFLLGIVLLISTGKGQIRIVLDDPKAEVEVRIDGEKIEIAGLGDPLSLSAGEHELTVAGPQYQAVCRSFTVRRGANPALTVTLDPVAPKPTAMSNVAKMETPAGAPPVALPTEELPKGRWISLSSPPESLKPARHQWGEVVVKDGVYDLASSGVWYSGLLLRDVAIRAKVKQLGARPSLSLREGESGGYSAVIMPDGSIALYKVRKKDGKDVAYVRLKSVKTIHDYRRFHEFEFSAVGDTLTVSIDGKLALQAHDDEIRESSRVAFGSYAGHSPSGHSLFRDVEMMDLSANIPPRLPATSGSASPEVFARESGTVLAIAVSADGRFVASAGGGEYENVVGVSNANVRLWDIASGKLLRVCVGHTGPILDIAFSHSGDRLVSASRDRTVRLWSCATGKELRLFSGHAEEVQCVAFSPTDDRIASGDKEGIVRLWDTASGQGIHVFHGHGWPSKGRGKSVDCLTFSSDGKRILSGGDDFAVQVWDAMSGPQAARLWSLKSEQEVKTLLGHSGRVVAVAGTPDPRIAVSVGEDKTARVWDLDRRGECRRILLDSEEIGHAAFSADTDRVLSHDRSNVLCLWDLRQASLLQRLPADPAGSTCVALSSDATSVFAGGTDRILRRKQLPKTVAATNGSGTACRAFRIIADSWAEFSSSKQGENNWYYGDTKKLGGEIQLMEYDSQCGRGAWRTRGVDGKPLITRYGGHPATGFVGVRRWISKVQGTVRISGNLGMNDGNPASDGITGHILVDGKEIWSKHIAGTDLAGVWYDLAADVGLGSSVDFAFTPGPTPWADGTKFTATVSVPEHQPDHGSPSPDRNIVVPPSRPAVGAPTDPAGGKRSDDGSAGGNKPTADAWLLTGGADPQTGRVVYALAPDGSRLTPLYSPKGLPANAWMAQPQLDGKGRFVFHVCQSVGAWDNGPLYYGVLGSDEVKPLANRWRDRPSGRVFWVPGADKVVFSNVGSGIHIIDLDPASDDEEVVTRGMFDECQGMLADGTIFYARGGMPLRTTSRDGKRKRTWDPLGENGTRYGAISPDGKYLAICHQTKRGLWIADAGGKLLTPLDKPLADFEPKGDSNNGLIAWSQDGTTIAFVNGGQLWSVKSNGGESRPLTKGQYRDLRNLNVWGSLSPKLPGVAYHES